jgi:uncharacterized protein involved in type VI secretion and phage assembly
MNPAQTAPSETSLEAGGHAKGVAVAVVAQNRDDSGLARVRVNYPWHSTPGESYWARIASPMAGKNRGAYFLPEVGDEVLVAFERGDLRFPYVVGALWNGVEKSPSTNGDGNNNVRLIRTPKGHQLSFDDGKPGQVQLKLADGKSLTIDDNGIVLDDNQGTKVTIDTKGGTVTVQAARSLSLKAPQISIEATTSLSLKAGGAVSVQGLPISLN